MRYVRPSYEPWIVSAALAGGLALGFAPFQQIAAQFSLRAGLGNLVAVNLVLPAAALGLAVFYPRVRTSIVAGLLIVVGFTLARLLYVDARIWSWQLQFVLDHTSPILVGAAVGCAVIGAFGAIVVSPFRRVGERPHTPSCAACGHALASSPGIATPPRCPECGTMVGTLGVSTQRQ